MADKEKKKSKTRRAGSSTRKKADSGNPGGGAGRRDEVGGSGVYPASGPLPQGKAPYKGEASWGQGERGAQGYRDSGDSEITSATSGQTKGEQTTSGGPEIARDQWKEFMDDFSRAHEGWITSVNVTEAGVRNEDEVQELPLMAVNIDLKHGEDDTVEIILGADTSHAITHSLAGVKHIRVNRDAQGVESGLDIEATSGKARLRFRSPASADTFDAVP